jgi:hypothetical protein
MAASAPDSFHVSYPFPLLVGVLAWAGGWGSLANITMRHAWHPRHGEIDAVTVVMVALMWGFGGLLGPLAVVRYSSCLRVSDGRLVFRRLFGLMKLEFRRADIRSYSVMRKGRRTVVTIVLGNGKSVEVDYWARNFQWLLAYLELKGPGR